jgi:hypothetical protein
MLVLRIELTMELNRILARDLRQLDAMIKLREAR